MKYVLFIIVLITLFSCSYQERKGLSPDQRNYDEKSIVTDKDQLRSPSDAIFIFKDNIYSSITKSLISLCDSIFGKGFVDEEDFSVFKSTIMTDAHRFDHSDPITTIDSKDLTHQLLVNKDGWYSLKYKPDDLSSDSPLKLSSNHIITQESTSNDLEIDVNGYNIQFFMDIYLNRELTKDGIYTVCDKHKKSESPYFKYNGKCQISISMIATDSDGKTEYYVHEINRPCDHYTQMHYTNQEVTYK